MDFHGLTLLSRAGSPVIERKLAALSCAAATSPVRLFWQPPSQSCIDRGAARDRANSRSRHGSMARLSRRRQRAFCAATLLTLLGLAAAADAQPGGRLHAAAGAGDWRARHLHLACMERPSPPDRCLLRACVLTRRQASSAACKQHGHQGGGDASARRASWRRQREQHHGSDGTGAGSSKAGSRVESAAASSAAARACTQ